MTGWQRSLFEQEESAGVEPGLSGLQHSDLTGGAWIDYVPGWVRRHDLAFDALVGAVRWRAERRPMYERTVDVPRLVARYEEGEPLPHPVVDEALSVLRQHYGADVGGPVATVSACLYRDGRDSVAWHGDRIGRGSTGQTVVAIVSLGHPRRLLLRPASGGASRSSSWGTATCW